MARTAGACAKMFRVLGDATRLRLVHALASGPRCVGALAKTLRARPARVSHHLAILKSAKIVAAMRRGRFIRYHLTADFSRCIQVDGRPGVALQFSCLDQALPRCAGAATRATTLRRL